MNVFVPLDAIERVWLVGAIQMYRVLVDGEIAKDHFGWAYHHFPRRKQ
jgi:hypothetical protein